MHLKKRPRTTSQPPEVSQKESLPESAAFAPLHAANSQIRADPQFPDDQPSYSETFAPMHVDPPSPMPAASTSSSSTQPMPMPSDVEQLSGQGTWQDLRLSTTRPFRPFSRATSWQTLPDALELNKRTKKPMIKNPLRHVQRLKRKDPAGLKFGGGLPGTRRLIGERLLQRLTPNTNPVVAEGRRFTDSYTVPMQVDGPEDSHPHAEETPLPTGEPRTRTRTRTEDDSRSCVRR